MKGPFFNQNRINYDILQYSNFEDVDIAMNAIALNYDVNVIEKIELEFFDTYWMTAVVNKNYNICIRYDWPIGLTIYAEDVQSNDMVTEIANYLSKEVFNEREEMGYKP